MTRTEIDKIKGSIADAHDALSKGINPGIVHDILDFCVRELGVLGGGGAKIHIRFAPPADFTIIATHGTRRVNAAGSNICEDRGDHR